MNVPHRTRHLYPFWIIFYYVLNTEISPFYCLSHEFTDLMMIFHHVILSYHEVYVSESIMYYKFIACVSIGWMFMGSFINNVQISEMEGGSDAVWHFHTKTFFWTFCDTKGDRGSKNLVFCVTSFMNGLLMRNLFRFH